jgi:hypothetical protein
LVERNLPLHDLSTAARLAEKRRRRVLADVKKESRTFRSSPPGKSEAVQRLPDSIESCSRGHGLEEDQMAAKEQKRQTAATGTTTKPKKTTSRGK